MKNIDVFFGESDIRIIDDGGRRWIAASDVARALEYKNPAVAVSDFINGNGELLEGHVEKFSMGQGKHNWFFDEHALIAYLVKTNQPKAVPFQKWAIDVLSKKIKETNSDQYTTIRFKSKKIRNDFTGVLKDHGISKPVEYIKLTYQTKRGLGIDPNKKKNDCDLWELCKISMAEMLSLYEIESKHPQGYDQISPLVKGAAVTVGSLKNNTDLAKYSNGLIEDIK